MCCAFKFDYTVQAYREISPVDNPDVLSRKEPLERNLSALNRQTPKKFALDVKPWANGTWRLDSGIIAGRYHDGYFKKLKKWKDRHDYSERHSLEEVFKEKDAGDRADLIDNLSPAEKYDLLVGEHQGELTRAQWSEGEKLLKKGTLDSWMGICEGGAAASVLYPEPQHAVDLKTPSGDPIRFHIMDIKALAALLWSSYNANIPISGSRCTKEAPDKDSNGVVTDESCFNSNPASFHIAILNFLGLRNRPFFMNRTVSVEVWNVPIIAYSVRYFNVVNGGKVQDLEGAIASLKDYPKDIYRRYRSPKAVSVVGVDMKVKMGRGTSHYRDSTESMERTESEYTYDLELDAKGDIVGGEWHQDQHPDFIWAVEPGYRPLSMGDILLGRDNQWDGVQVPTNWQNAARISSARNQPLEAIVSKLVELSVR